MRKQKFNPDLRVWKLLGVHGGRIVRVDGKTVTVICGLGEISIKNPDFLDPNPKVRAGWGVEVYQFEKKKDPTEKKIALDTLSLEPLSKRQVRSILRQCMVCLC